MIEYFSVIDIEHREDGLYYLVAVQWDLKNHTVERKSDFSVTYKDYAKAAWGRELAYEMWELYEAWHRDLNAKD